jgi:hypothetical protein
MFLSMFSPIHHRSVCVCEYVFVCINAEMLDCPVSDQSGTGTKKPNDAGNGPVPEQAKAVRHFFSPVLD